MRKSPLLLASAVVFCTLLLGIGLAWALRQQWLDQAGRPWLARQISNALAADTRLEKIELEWGYLQVSGIEIIKTDQFKLDIDRVVVDFNWLGLLRRNLHRVQVVNPSLVLTVTDTGQPHSPGELPRNPPLEIDTWLVENGRLQVNWTQQPLVIQAFQASGRLAPLFVADLQAQVGEDSSVPFACRLTGDWQAGLELTLETLEWDGQSLLTEPLQFSPGALSATGGAVSLPQLQAADVTRVLQAIGQVPPWPAGLDWSVQSPRVAFRWHDDHLRMSLETADGQVEYADRTLSWRDFALELSDHKMAWQVSARLGFNADNHFGCEGQYADQAFTGRWQLWHEHPMQVLVQSDAPSQSPLRRLQALRATGEIRVDRKSVRFTQGSLEADIAELGMLRAAFSGSWQEDKAAMRVDELKVVAADQAQVLVEATLQAESSPGLKDWQGRWQAGVADTAPLTRAFGISPLPLAVNLKAFSVAGSFVWQGGALRVPACVLQADVQGEGLAGKLRGELAGSWASTGRGKVVLNRFRVEHLEYFSADGLTGLTGGHADIGGQISLVQDIFEISLIGQVGVQEALCGSWYADLRQWPLHVNAQGKFKIPGARLVDFTANVNMSGVMGLDIRGAGDANAVAGDVQLAIPDLSGDFLTAARAVTGSLMPALNEIDLAGQLTASATVRHSPGNWLLRADVMPDNVDVSWAQDNTLRGVTGEVPIILSSQPGANLSRRVGKVRWQALRSGLVSSAASSISLEATDNRWQLLEPLRLQLGGGGLHVSKADLSLHEGQPVMRFSLLLDGISLAQVSTSLEWPLMEGALNAKFDDILVTPSEVKTIGSIATEVFGGNVLIRNLRVREPLSRFPTYHADVDFNGLDLFQLTRTFEFGEINGVADGFVHNLRLFDGTPSAFEARFETRDAGTRNISVKAIRNLNTLSQGGLADALSQGVYRFIDFYRYRKIGVLCSLKNDLFTLEGAARESFREYLVYGGLLPPRIDVIVSSPVISFKEMVRRLKRIERAGH